MSLKFYEFKISSLMVEKPTIFSKENEISCLVKSGKNLKQTSGFCQKVSVLFGTKFPTFFTRL